MATVAWRLRRFNRLLRRLGFQRDWFLIPLAAVIGIFGGVIATGFSWLVHEAGRLFFGYYGKEVFPLSNYALLIALPAFGGMAVGLIQEYLSRTGPTHGIPEVMEALARRSGRMPVRMGLFKTITASLTIGSGGSGGVEGPIIQTGSVLGSVFGQVLRVNREQMHTLVGCGAAAGMAGIFNAPIAAVMFVLEIMLRDFSVKTFIPVVVASVFGAVITQELLGANVAVFNIPEALQTYQLSIYEVGPYVLLGVLCGLVGVAFTFGEEWSEQIWHSIPGPHWLRPAYGGATLGVLGLLFVLIFGQPVPQFQPPAFFSNGYPVTEALLDPVSYASTSPKAKEAAEEGIERAKEKQLHQEAVKKQVEQLQDPKKNKQPQDQGDKQSSQSQNPPETTKQVQDNPERRDAQGENAGAGAPGSGDPNPAQADPSESGPNDQPPDDRQGAAEASASSPAITAGQASSRSQANAGDQGDSGEQADPGGQANPEGQPRPTGAAQADEAEQVLEGEQGVEGDVEVEENPRLPASIALLLGLLVLKLIGTVITMGSGGSGGFIAPSLFIGATLGGAFAMTLQAIGIFPGFTPATYALASMAGVIAATIHCPLTAFLLVFEVTQDYRIILPTMLVAILAVTVSQFVNRDSIYTSWLRRQGVRIGSFADMVMLRRLTVADVPLTPAVIVHAEEPAQRLLELAEDFAVVDYVVCDDQECYQGMVVGQAVQTTLLQREAIPLMIVGELMRDDLPTATRDESLDVVLDKFSSHEVSSLVVVDANNQAIGMITRARLMQRYQRMLEE